MMTYLDFEKPVAELQARIAELRAASEGGDVDISGELAKLESKSAGMLASTYASLSPWQKTQVARHPMRPHFRDFVELAFDDFMPLGGDRLYGDDQAIMGGFATLRGRRVMLIGHEKGNDTQSRLRHNFGMGKPEGYRKAIRLMEMASRFGLPVVTLVDTSGAFPGVEAEERGQAEAIARSTEACLALDVPMVAVIVPPQPLMVRLPCASTGPTVPLVELVRLPWVFRLPMLVPPLLMLTLPMISAAAIFWLPKVPLPLALTKLATALPRITISPMVLMVW